MAHNKALNPDPEEMRKDLLAALAAGRELGPEMDAAIVDAHLRRHYGDAAKPKAPAATAVEHRSLQPAAYLPALMMILGMVAYVTVLIVSRGGYWWLFWPFMAWGWWGWGTRRRHWARDARWQYRQFRRYGGWGDDPYEVGYYGQAGGHASTSAPHEFV
jgi:hypothetical protein